MAKLNSTVTVEQAQANATADRQAQSDDVMLQAILDSMEKDRAAREAAMPSAKPRLWGRIKDTFTGAEKSYGSGMVDAQRALYEAGQGSRNAMNNEYLNDYQRNLDRAKLEYDVAVKENDKGGMAAAQNEIEYYQRLVDSMSKVVNENVQQEAAAAAGGLADDLQVSGQKDIEKAKEGLGKVGQTVVDAGVGAIQLANDIAAGAIAPGGSQMAMAQRTFGGTTQQARQEGADLDKQLLGGAAAAGVGMLTNKLFDGLAYGKGIISQSGVGQKLAASGIGQKLSRSTVGAAVNKAVATLGKTAAGRAVLGRLKGAGGEAIEEMAERLLTPLVDSIYNGKTVGQNYNELKLEEILHDGIVGGMIGLFGGGNYKKSDIAPQLTDNIGGTQTAQPMNEGIAAAGLMVNGQPGITPQNVNPTAPLDNLGSARGGFDPLSRAEIEYGTQEGSANAVRPDDMPVSTNGVNRVSESAVTVKGAAVTPDEFVPLLERSVMDTSAPNGLRYMPITNDATVQSAMDAISTEGWESALNQWQKDVSAGRVSAKITAMGAILYNHAVNSGNTQLALDIISDYAANGRAAARGLQAMRILQTLTPDSRLYMIQRSLNKMAEDMNLPDGIKISEETMQEYRDAQTEEAHDAAIDKMQGEIADQLWQTRWADGRKLSTLKNKWNALRYVNMLGNFKTQVRNVLGNVGMAAMTRAKDAVASGVEALASAATGGKIERTKSAFVGRDLLNAAKADFANVEQQALGESRYSLNEGRGIDATGLVRGAQDKAQVFRFKPLEAYRKATNYAMEKGDVIFSKANYSRALAGWLQAHKITAEQMNDPAWRESNTELLDRGRAYAIKEAQESTFRDNNAVSQLMSKIGRSKDSSVPAKALNVALEGLLPFRKTPANVLVRAEEYSPLGIVNTAVLAAKKANGNTDITGADIINQASKALTGTGVFILGMALRNAGLLRGGEDEDKDQKYFDQLTGHQNYSLELPDGTSYTLDWITPGSIPLFMGSAMADAVAEGGFQLKDLGEAFTKITDPMLEMSMLSGVNDALANIKNTDGGLLPKLAISLGLDYLTQGLTNTMLGQLERIGETERMTYYTDKNSALPDYIQKKLSKASAKIPGWDYQQREWVDAWGQTESTGGLGERVLTNMFSPGYVSKVDIDSVEKELQRLADATGSTTIFPDTAEKSITVNGETIYLESDKYLKYAKQKGQESAKLCKKLMDSAGYKALSDEDKVDAVRKVYEYATAGAKEKVSDYRVGDSSWINKARSNPMPIQDYIVAYEKYGGSAGIEKQQKIAAAAKQTGMAVDSFTKLKEAESAAVKAKNANSDTNHSRWTKKELMGYIEKNYPKNQWNNVFNTYKSYSNLNWKNPY